MRSFVLNITFVLLSFVALSQTITSKLDTTSILIGDQTNITIVANDIPLDSFFKIQNDSIFSKIEVIESSIIDTIDRTENSISLSQIITITAWDTGFYVIPPYVVDGLKDSNTIYSNPLLLEVKGVQLKNDNSIYGNKENFNPEFSIWEFKTLIIWGIIILTLLIGGIILIIYLLRKKKSNPIEITEPKRPFMEVIWERIELLEQKSLWQKGLEKEYHSEITDILRSFLEWRFKIVALEETTNNILNQLKTSSISTEDLENISSVLKFADLVKFAKQKGIDSQHTKSLSDLKIIIKGNTLKAENE